MDSLRKSPIGRVGAVALLFTLAACDDASVGPEAETNVAIRFATSTATSAAATAAATATGTSTVPFASGDGHGLVIEGSNGTLTLTDVRLIVAEFELDRFGVSCDDSDSGEGSVDDDGCEEFEAPPAFIDLPLNGAEALAVEQPVPVGEYDELEFEVEDLDDDEEEGSELRQQIEELRQAIREEFPDWPRDASILVTGEFAPTDGSPTPFRAYFEAEVEIEREIAPPLRVTEDDTAPSVTVRVDPAVWFRMPDGTVLDLRAFDFDATGEVFEFEVEFEDGVMELEWDD